MARFTPSASIAAASKGSDTASCKRSGTDQFNAPAPTRIPPQAHQVEELPLTSSSSSPAPSHPDQGGIRAISRTDVHRITSGQVVLDLSSAVKELVENALDAGATSLEIRFKNFGLDSLEVVDNGIGIKSEDYHSVALKHHTSKIEHFDDLNYVKTFGFRGEALSSLCALGEVNILTATKEEAPMGTLLDFAQDGSIADSSRRMARQRGTTVTVSNLFHSLPVRRRDLEKNCKREYGKAQALLQAYALISKGVRWNVTNITKEGRKNPAMTISSALGNDWVSRNFASLFGAKTPMSLQTLDIQLQFEKDQGKKRNRVSKGVASAKRLRRESSEEAEIPNLDSGGEEEDENEDDEDDDQGESSSAWPDTKDKHQSVHIKGLISKPSKGSGRTSSDRQFLYINGRPWDNLKVTKAFNEIYRQFNTSQYPVVVADFALPTDTYDVNVSPDKRTIFLHDEPLLIEALKTALDDLFAPSRGTLAVNMAYGSGQASGYTQQRLPFDRTGPSSAFEAESENEQEEEEQNSSVGCLVEKGQEGHSGLDAADDRLEEETSDGRESETDSSTPSETDGEGTDPISVDGIEKDASVPVSARRDSAHRAHLPSTMLPPTRQQGPPASGTQISSSSGHPSSTTSRSHPIPGVRHSVSTRLTSRTVGLPSMLAGYKAPGSQLSYLSSGQREGASEEEDSHDQLTAEEIEALEYREEGLDHDQIVDEASSEATEHELNVQPQGLKAKSGEEDPEVLRSQHVSYPHDGQDDEDERNHNLARLDTETVEEQADHDLPVTRAATGIASSSSDGTIAIDIDSLRGFAERRKRSLHQRKDDQQTHGRSQTHSLSSAGVSNLDAQKVESELQRIITKTDFARMEILGQFNLGFIIARRVGELDGTDDLFIIDQHAADEKFNFETLQNTTKMRSQRLIQPRLLELSASDELVAVQHVETIRLNGFDIDIHEEGVAGSRIKLLAQPVSKGTTFGVRDLEELLFLLRDVTPGSAKASQIRCSKVRSMFASRACRKSVMIGTALTSRQMTSIVRQMGSIEQPWNCPHGRPTMRHLACLESLQRKKGGGRRKVDWARVKDL